MGKNNTSRKGKKAWRKNISDADVEAYQEKKVKDAKTGGDVTAIEDDALFFIDKQPEEAQRPSKAARRAAALKAPLAVDRILSVKSPFQYPVAVGVTKKESVKSKQKIKTRQVGVHTLRHLFI